MQGTQDCVFLVGGTKCSIHEVWPLQCKTYPFWPGLMDPAAWVNERATMCEGISHEDAPQVGGGGLCRSWVTKTGFCNEEEPVLDIPFSRSTAFSPEGRLCES